MKNNLNILVTSVIVAFCGFITACGSFEEIPTNQDMIITTTTTQEETITTTTIATTTTTSEIITTTTENTTEPTTTQPTTTQLTTTEPMIFGKNLDEIYPIAEDLYNQACIKYRDILIDCTYGVDLYQCIVNQVGTRYYLVTNGFTIDNVFEDWHTVFTSNLDNLIDEKYITYNEQLYAYTGIQQKNTNYKGTTLSYYSTNGNDVIFKATCNYSSGDKIFKFILTYYPETDSWRVNKFTMPY